jgi:hypothetical protein
VLSLNRDRYSEDFETEDIIEIKSKKKVYDAEHSGHVKKAGPTKPYAVHDDASKM